MKKAINLSIIIPSRDCPYTMKTVRNILDNSVTNIEMMVNIDGNPPEKFIEDKRVTYIIATVMEL